MTDLETAGVDRRSGTALAAVAGQFFINGALYASVLPRLPTVRDQVGVSTDQLGLIMAAAGALSFLASAVVSRVVEALGTRRVMLYGTLVVSAGLVVVGFSGSVLVLLCGLALMMVFDLFVDVAMNLQGAWLSAERRFGVMNRLHGLWSLGTVVGGLATARIAAVGVDLPTHLLGAGVALASAGLVVARFCLRFDRPTPTPDSAKGNKASRRLPVGLAIALTLAGLAALSVESTALDWAAFRLGDDLGAPEEQAALGYVAVSLGMMVGRFGGDGVAHRLGPLATAAVTAALAATGLVLASTASTPVLVIAGYALAGLGISTMMPILYEQAAGVKGRPGAGLGALTAGLRIAGVGGPILVGVLAEEFSVGLAVAATALPAIAAFLAAFGALQLRKQL